MKIRFAAAGVEEDGDGAGGDAEGEGEKARDADDGKLSREAQTAGGGEADAEAGKGARAGGDGDALHICVRKGVAGKQHGEAIKENFGVAGGDVIDADIGCAIGPEDRQMQARRGGVYGEGDGQWNLRNRQEEYPSSALRAPSPARGEGGAVVVADAELRLPEQESGLRG